MKIAVVGDLHIIAQDDPFLDLHSNRLFFKDAWSSFRELTKKIRNEAPDVIIFVGDIVDWYSHENRNFALELISECNRPWLLVPGNHDFDIPFFENGVWRKSTCTVGYSTASNSWNKVGIEIGNRYIEGYKTGIFLINSALSDVPMGTKEWMKQYLPKNERNIMLTHVPFDTQPIRRFIMDKDPGKNMTKYVQSHAPDLFDEQIQQQVDFVFTGHLHFTGLIKESKAEHHFIGMGITPVNHNKGYTARCYMVDIGDKIEYRVVN